MNAAVAYADLLHFGKPVLRTGDAALRLGMGCAAATRMLGRLAHAGLVKPLRHGLWSLVMEIDPLLLPEYLTAPYPAYVSFYTALYLHGMISQIPQITYVASLGQPRRVETAVGKYSIHRLSPEYFGGYEVKQSGIKIATPEKALVDVLYLSNVRSRLFGRLPELELTSTFRVRNARRWVSTIRDPHRRAMVSRRLEAILAGRPAR